MNANELACEVPVVELLEAVPKDARFVQEEDFSSTYHPVGRLCHEAATMLRQQQADIELLEKALEQIATGEIVGESTNYKDTVYVMRQIASDALAILRKGVRNESIQ